MSVYGEQQAEAIEILRELLHEGDRVWCDWGRSNRDGDAHQMRCFIVSTGRISNITAYVARAIGEPYSTRSRCMTVHGGGMDMRAETVMTLSVALFGRANDGAYKLRMESM